MSKEFVAGELAKSFAPESIPRLADLIEEFARLLAKNKLTEKGFGEIVNFIKDPNIKNMPKMTFLDKKSLLVNILGTCKTNDFPEIDRFAFSKYLKTPLLVLEKTCYLDINQVTQFALNDNKLDQTALLRKYGPTKEEKYDSPFRQEFATALNKKDYLLAKELVFILNFRKVGSLKEITKSTATDIEQRFLEKALIESLDLAILEKEFAKTLKNIRTTPTENSALTESITIKNINFIKNGEA